MSAHESWECGDDTEYSKATGKDLESPAVEC